MSPVKKILAFAFVSISLVACAPVWVKPGASQNDFAQDKYSCMQQSQQRVSGAYVNAYGGAASEKVVTNEGLFNACMQSRGWSLQSRDSVAQSASINQNKKEQFMAGTRSISEEGKARCADQDYAAYYAKTPCGATSPTIQQLSDTSRATKKEKEAILKVDASLAEIRDQRIALYRNTVSPPALMNKYIDTAKRTFDRGQKIRLDLYNGKITWGQYNTLRKELAEKSTAEYQGK